MHDIPQGFTIFREDLEHVSKQLDAVWPNLRGARIFITGGTGFFGIWLLESLLWVNQTRELGIHLAVLSRAPERFLNERAPHLRRRQGLSFVAGRLTDFDIPAEPCTHILHAASETNLEKTGDWAERHLTSAIDGTRRVLEMAVEHQCKSMLVTTSGAVYSQADSIVGQHRVEGPMGVADFVSERSVYSQAKRTMEIMTAIAAQKHGFNALIARCFAFVGPYLSLDGNYAIGNFMRDALREREIVVGGDGTPLRSYLYAADLVVWLLTILVRGRSGRPYNVGGHQPISIGDLARTVAAMAGRPESAVTIRDTPVPGAIPSAYLPSLARAEKDLGLRVAIPMEEAILRTLAWHRKQRGMSGAQ
ncbi:MAG: NAD-dependent epimerase/dehydratase family protein [Janthinobacterium lividum]